MKHAGEPLTLAHQAELEPLLNAARQASVPEPQLTLSDATFANLYLFRAAHDWRYFRGAGGPGEAGGPGCRPCLVGKAYDGSALVLPLFAWDGVPHNEIGNLLQRVSAGSAGGSITVAADSASAPPASEVPPAVSATFGACLGPLSEAQAARLSPAHHDLTASRDDADYLYRAEAFRHYAGSVLQKKRNLVKQLLAAHTVHSEPYHPGLAAEALQVLAGWLQDKSKPAGAADDAPCSEALALATRLNLQGTLYRINGHAAGFLLAETLAPGVMVMRFAKALGAYKGLYQHMFQHFCQSRPALEWLNFEQDLGSPNFRQTKLSYQPAALLTKYRARLR